MTYKGKALIGKMLHVPVSLLASLSHYMSGRDICLKHNLPSSHDIPRKALQSRCWPSVDQYCKMILVRVIFLTTVLFPKEFVFITLSVSLFGWVLCKKISRTFNSLCDQ